MNPSWLDLYKHHFTQYFGKPFDVQRFQADADGPSLQVATFDQRYPNYRIFASLGLTNYRDAVQDLGEVILLADAALKDVPLLFVNSLFYVIDRRIPLGSRFTIGGIDNLNAAFADHFDKVALYYTIADGFPEGFERLAWDHEVGLVYQALFISAAEQDFIQRRGAQAFEERLRSQDADLCSLRRPSCV
jgi:Suppressor of fused protein (SUFU)